MKKIFSIIICLSAFVFTFSSCKNEEDDIFDKSSAKRLEEAKIHDANVLTSSSNGWAMEYFAKDGMKGYMMLVNFKKDGSAMVASRNEWTNNAYLADTSLWKMIGDNGPVLTFDSYNEVLHKFSTPEDIPGTPEDEQGLGMEGDYEFIVIDAPDNAQQVMLKGKKHGNYIRLTRLSEEQDWKQYFDQVDKLTADVFGGANNYLQLCVDGTSQFSLYNGASQIFNIIPKDGDPIMDENNVSLVINSKGLRLKTAFDAKGHTVQNFVLNDDKTRLICVDEGATGYYVVPQAEAPYFVSTMQELKKWVLSKNMSEKARVIYDRAEAGFKDKTLTLSSVTYLYSSARSSHALQVIATKSGSRNIGYFDMNIASSSDNVISSSYLGTSDNNGTAFLKYDGLKELIDMLGSSYKLAGASSALNLSLLKLVNTEDSDIWFELKQQ